MSCPDPSDDEPGDLPPSVDRLLQVLELERLDRDLFRAYNPPYRTHGRLFGGQVAAHALRAAAHTVEADHHPHSLHGYFLRPGRPGAHTILQVDRIRDGRSFTTRNVVAVQEGEAIFALSASFHTDEPGGEYQVPAPTGVPHPDELARSGHAHEPGWDNMAPFERFDVSPEWRADGGSSRRVWIRTRGRLPDDPPVHAAVLTYVSDMGAVGASRRVLGHFERRGMGASLDHAMWFHRRVRADDWLLFDMRPLSNAGARGLVVGTLHTEAGVLVASMAQEVLIRTDR